MAFRGQHWSNTKFAEWLRKKGGVPTKPTSATAEGWNMWEDAAKETGSILYWIAEEGLDKVQNFINWPIDQVKEVQYYLRNRFITKTHIAPAYGLPKGKWHETDTRLLHSMFSLLVDFVEVESAWHNTWSKENVPGSYLSRLIKGKWRPWRSAKDGIEYYEWARSLNSEDFGGQGPSHQAIAAEEILHLYAWWTVTRPNRRDPYWLYQKVDKIKPFSGFGRNTPEQKASLKEAFDEVHRLEEIYHNEDEEKMIRLVKIRQSLWT